MWKVWSLGSVLAGTFHNINGNDFPACHSDCPAASSVVYVDDDSDNVHAHTEDELSLLLQTEVKKSLSWLSDNRLCPAPDKSKVLVPGTSKLKRIRLQNNVQIYINGQLVSESSSEKVLGVILNNEMTFRHHLYGNDEHEGLIPQLSKRAGVLTKLSKIISPEKIIRN